MVDIMPFICWWQGCWGCGHWVRGLCAWHIAIAWSIVTPLLCPGREPICISLKWLVALVGVMGLKNVVIVLCGWVYVAILLSFNNFSLCLLSSSKKSPTHHWSSYSITLRSVQKPCLKRQWYPIVNIVTNILFFVVHSLMTQMENCFFLWYWFISSYLNL